MSATIVNSQAIKMNGNVHLTVMDGEGAENSKERTNTHTELSDEEGIENVVEKKRSKRKYVKKSKQLVVDLEEEPEKSKPKRKSRLSLNSDVKNKIKTKENHTQGSIKSFFQTLSPRAEENLKDVGGVVEKDPERLIKLEDEGDVENGLLINKTKKKGGEDDGRSNKKPKKGKKKHRNREIETKKAENEILPKLEENGFKSDNLNEDDKELKKVRFSSDVEELSPQPVRKNSSIRDEVDEAKNEIRNAFTFMMDSRHKSIGQNSPGKEPEKLEESPEAHKEVKKKLSSRKAIFEEWANSKGANKRKLDDEETGIVIEHKLKKRAKRLKKLLTNIDEKNTKKCKNERDCDLVDKGKRKRKEDEKEGCNSKKPKLLICSNSESDVIVTNKPKNKLQMKRRDSGNDSKILKTASKLTLKKNVEKEKDKEIVTTLTSNNIKQWKMKLKVSLENVVGDEDNEKLIQSPKKMIESDIDEDVKVVLDSDDEPLSFHKERAIKLAPLFVKSKPKAKVDEATIEARRQFLHSTIPDSLKKTIEKQQRVEELNYQIFPTRSHIFAKPTVEDVNSFLNFRALPKVELQLTSSEDYSPTIGLLSLGSMTSSTDFKAPEIDMLVGQKINLKWALKQIKMQNPDYPVYKAFKVLYQKYLKSNPEITRVNKSKKGRSKKKSKDPEMEISGIREIWTDLYKPNTSEEIFGNASSISQFKSWLETWLEFTEEINLQRRKRRINSDSDFESTDDGESKDSTRLPGNTLILTGPHGSGKTTAVYALCNELGINVLEINASSKRTGKRLLQELQEATQSHQVRKTDILNAYLKNGSRSEPNKTKKMCLLLIEDVDIVFEQDDNFITALGQLLATSKRPVVLTTTDLNCLHLKKFVLQYPVFNFASFSAKMLATWIQIICLIEGVHVERETIVEVMEANKGDIRRTLLQMQFWVQSGGQLKNELQRSVVIPTTFEGEENLSHDDDGSNISWLRDEEDGSFAESVILHRIRLQENDSACPVNLGDFWWKIPDLIKIPTTKLNVNSKPQKTTSEHLKNVSNVFETIAFTDVTFQKLNLDCDLEPVHSAKTVFIKDSLELNKSLETYTSNKDLACELTKTLLGGYLNRCGDANEWIEPEENLIRDIKSWRTKRNKCDASLSEVVPMVCHLDRASVNLDYLATIRTMARSEMIRASNNNKRRNRFYNYLRGVGISCNDSLVQDACNTFSHYNF